MHIRTHLAHLARISSLTHAEDRCTRGRRGIHRLITYIFSLYMYMFVFTHAEDRCTRGRRGIHRLITYIFCLYMYMFVRQQT